MKFNILIRVAAILELNDEIYDCVDTLVGGPEYGPIKVTYADILHYDRIDD